MNPRSMNPPVPLPRSLPDATRQILLEACLAKGPAAVTAWQTWQATVNFDDIDHPSQRLMPLLHHNLRLAGVPEEATDMGRYHGIQRKAWYENRRLAAELAGMLARLTAAGIETVVLKGLALEQLYYPSGGLRPIGDGDVWIARDQTMAAVDLLLEAGWRPAHGCTREQLLRFERPLRHGWEFYGPGGAGLDLHWQPASVAGPPELERLLRLHARPLSIHNFITKTLCATHLFYHVCLLGVIGGRSPAAHWVADAMMVLRGTEPVSWELFGETVRLHRTSRLMKTVLGFLRARFGAPIPEAAITELETATEAPWEALEFAALAQADERARSAYFWRHRFSRWRALQPEWREPSWPVAWWRYTRLRLGEKPWTRVARKAWEKARGTRHR